MIGERHFVDAAMALDAADTFVYMNAMVEIGKLGQVVNPHPCDRHTGSIAGPHRLKGGRSDPNLLMAVHADLCSRNACKRRRLHRGVTIPTVDAQLADVVSMAKFHRLDSSHSFLRDIGRPTDYIQGHAKNNQAYQRRNNTDLGKCIETSMKDLRHAEDVLKGSVIVGTPKKAN